MPNIYGLVQQYLIPQKALLIFPESGFPDLSIFTEDHIRTTGIMSGDISVVFVLFGFFPENKRELGGRELM